MKRLQKITLIFFAILIALPILTFNFEKDAVSSIDNRMLAQNPFDLEYRTRAGADLSKDISNYVTDRIGLRDKMILGYTLLNDRLFGKMVHPTYTYGKDGYIFFKISENIQYGEFHEAFVDMVVQIQRYCEARNVPFLFVFEPRKDSVLTEYLPDGVHYDNSWSRQLLSSLEAKGVTCIDNTQLLIEKTEEGEAVFNQKYDAGHWNQLGGYYCTKQMLEAIQVYFPGTHVNDIEEFDISETLKTTLQVSEFPIHEMVPSFKKDIALEDRTAEFGAELVRDNTQRAFGYYVNPERLQEGSPRVLVFQGSHLNDTDKRLFLSNGLGEYIFVHNYQNVINFPYYYNIFQPECVVLEVAETSLLNAYFNYERMCAMNLNPVLETVLQSVTEDNTTEAPLPDALAVEEGTSLTKLIWIPETVDAEFAWLCLDQPYDMQKTADGTGYEVTVQNTVYEQNKESLKIVASHAETVTIYG